MNSIEHTYT